MKCELSTHEYYSFITGFDIRVCKLLELFISIPLLSLFIHKLNCIYSHVIHLVFTCYSQIEYPVFTQCLCIGIQKIELVF